MPPRALRSFSICIYILDSMVIPQISLIWLESQTETVRRLNSSGGLRSLAALWGAPCNFHEPLSGCSKFYACMVHSTSTKANLSFTHSHTISLKLRSMEDSSIISYPPTDPSGEAVPVRHLPRCSLWHIFIVRDPLPYAIRKKPPRGLAERIIGRSP